MEPSQTNPFPKSDANGNLIRSDVEQAAERVKATTAQAIDRTADAAASALDEAAAKREQLRASQQRLMSNAAECMHSYPLATIGLAFGAGFLISRLLGRSND
ncbi:Bacterial protein of uncharacterised function (DUF883) [Ralstonia pickettii]|jgi:ElaB/YqjD/DUF883 family membrane-anchored ribosome-binding protein|uniref:hypothetical protein n=1 Tax=Ralstonia TaxID=48736 RepID=UPI0001E69A44|nr:MULTISPECIES: hypothetical protein [Ralstonia]EFP67692.1 hypothetical protein HMPREF1004_00606 [Ralstonia pickettii]EGY65830.1 hypothetical protein HMPREF0989_00333 [Ralstonia sp. 5_2_56FAA]KFL23039.1 hypothetical protein DP23_2529 [Ralstonia pickettii]MBU6524859.1 hypothetical protein [Ralstonia sp. B265]NPT49716.1 hypothetical protein [Ralstonia sp. 3N]